MRAFGSSRASSIVRMPVPAASSAPLRRPRGQPVPYVGRVGHEQGGPEAPVVDLGHRFYPAGIVRHARIMSQSSLVNAATRRDSKGDRHRPSDDPGRRADREPGLDIHRRGSGTRLRGARVRAAPHRLTADRVTEPSFRHGRPRAFAVHLVRASVPRADWWGRMRRGIGLAELVVLAVDDEQPALDELVHLLGTTSEWQRGAGARCSGRGASSENSHDDQGDGVDAVS